VSNNEPFSSSFIRAGVHRGDMQPVRGGGVVFGKNGKERVVFSFQFSVFSQYNSRNTEH
jgi:hypothetical protein